MSAALRLALVAACAAGTVCAQTADLAGYADAVRAADALLARGDYGGVVQRLEPWAERLPGRPEARHFLGLALYRLRDFAAAADHLSACLALERAESAAWRQTVEILGPARYFAGQFREAAPLLEQAAAWRPDDSDLLYSLAMTRLQLGQRDRARIAFAKIFGVDPAAAEAFALAAGLALRENRPADAEALLRAAVERRPDLHGAAYELGVLAFRGGDYGRSAALLRSELSRNPGHALAWHALGETLAALGQPAAAVEALKRAVWLDKRLARSLLLLAKIHLGQGGLELAEASVQRALEIEPRSYEAHFLQSRIHYKAGRPDRAKRQLAIAEEIRRAELADDR